MREGYVEHGYKKVFLCGVFLTLEGLFFSPLLHSTPTSPTPTTNRHPIYE